PQDFFQVLLKKAPLSEDNVRYFGQQLLEGLKYIHEAGVTHCDLKPQNVLVASGMLLKISDFGLSEDSDSAAKSRKVVGTPGFWAPEVVMRKAHTTKLDTFSMGIICYIMFTRSMPSPALTDRVSAYPPKADYLEHLEVSSVAKRFLDCCLNFDVVKRPDAAKALRHRFFRAGACPTTLADDFDNGPAASVPRGIKHSRSDSARGVEARVRVIRSFTAWRAARVNEWREVVAQAQREQSEMQAEEDEVREAFGNEFEKAGTKEEEKEEEEKEEEEEKVKEEEVKEEEVKEEEVKEE
ncbi:hypothetical protein EC991_008916, partial [Linnemannia zychae]